MSQKFTYEGYTICVTFRSDNALAITASFNLTGQHFLNDMVQLGKIKKDTVLATLAKKNPKNLWCKFKMVDSNPRKLVISFVVSFDYLPQFSEDLVLDYVEIKGSSLNRISSVELQTDIDQIEKVLDAINKNGAVNIHEKVSSVNQKTAITSFEVNQGAYLLQITGVIANATTVHDTIQFFIKQDYSQQQVSLKQKSYSQHGYGYPFFFCFKIDSKGGKIQISAKNNGGTASLTNQIITLVPILGKA